MKTKVIATIVWALGFMVFIAWSVGDEARMIMSLIAASTVLIGVWSWGAPVSGLPQNWWKPSSIHLLVMVDARKYVLAILPRQTCGTLGNLVLLLTAVGVAQADAVVAIMQTVSDGHLGDALAGRRKTLVFVAPAGFHPPPTLRAWDGTEE